MKASIFWLTDILTDVVFAFFFYLWRYKDVQNAGNVVLLIVWYVTSVRLFIGVFCDKSSFKDDPRGKGYAVYYGLTNMLAIGALAWIGYVGTAGLLLFATMLKEAARRCEKRPS